MAQKTKVELKAYYVTGLRPNESNYVDLVDSLALETELNQQNLQTTLNNGNTASDVALVIENGFINTVDIDGGTGSFMQTTTDGSYTAVGSYNDLRETDLIVDGLYNYDYGNGGSTQLIFPPTGNDNVQNLQDSSGTVALVETMNLQRILNTGNTASDTSIVITSGFINTADIDGGTGSFMQTYADGTYTAIGSFNATREMDVIVDGLHNYDYDNGGSTQLIFPPTGNDNVQNLQDANGTVALVEQGVLIGKIILRSTDVGISKIFIPTARFVVSDFYYTLINNGDSSTCTVSCGVGAGATHDEVVGDFPIAGNIQANILRQVSVSGLVTELEAIYIDIKSPATRAFNIVFIVKGFYL